MIAAPARAASTLCRAIEIALTVPQGPVSIEIPIDIQAKLTKMPANVLPELFALSKQESFDVGRAASSVYFDWHNLKWMTNGQRWHWFLQTFFPPVDYMMKRDGLKSRAQLPWAYLKRIIGRLL